MNQYPALLGKQQNKLRITSIKSVQNSSTNNCFHSSQNQFFFFLQKNTNKNIKKTFLFEKIFYLEINITLEFCKKYFTKQTVFDIFFKKNRKAQDTLNKS